MVHQAFRTTAVWFELINSLFVHEQNLVTCVLNAGCTGTGQKTAKIQETLLQVPEEYLHSGNSDVIQVQQLENYENCFEYESGSGSINVKNRLKNSSSFWKNVYTSDFIMDVIESSCKIPFINEPENIILKNNKSALVKKTP